MLFLQKVAGDLAPSANYGQCSNIYCHSPGQSGTGGALAGGDYAAPTWGGTVACGSCHATTGLTSGSHAAHLTFTGTTRDIFCSSQGKATRKAKRSPIPTRTKAVWKTAMSCR